LGSGGSVGSGSRVKGTRYRKTYNQSRLRDMCSTILCIHVNRSADQYSVGSAQG
jgi:hypothetical protein